MNIAFFLGAGFSSTFGHPVMNRFFSYVDASRKVSPDDKKFLDEMVLEARKASSFLHSSPTNLEDILSFFVMGQRLRLVDSAEESSRRMRKILQAVYTDVGQMKGHWERYDILKKFLGSVLEEKALDLSVITTNYDLNIECALLRLRVPFHPGFRYSLKSSKFGQKVGDLYSNAGIPVYKLHGSVNWYEFKDDPETFEVDNALIAVDAHGDEEAKFPVLPAVCAYDYPVQEAPVIVPPSFIKPPLEGALGAIWSGAAKALQKAHIVFFVGYSFPSYDTEMMYFFARAFVDNPHLRSIVIVDLKAQEIAKKLKGASSKSGSHFKEMIDPYDTDWTKFEVGPVLRKYS